MIRTTALILICTVLAGPALAQEKEKTKETDEPAFGFDDLLVKKEELPEGATLVEGMHCVSIQPVTFFRMPDMKGFLPAPKQREEFRKLLDVK